MTVQEFVTRLNREKGNSPRTEVVVDGMSSGRLVFGGTHMGSVMFEEDGSIRSAVLLNGATMEFMRLISRVFPDLKVS